MYHAGHLTVRAALLYAPNDMLKELRGVFIRDVNINRTPVTDTAIANSAWRQHAHIAEQSMSLRLEGIVSNDVAVRYLRKSGIEGIRLRLEITWPNIAISDGEFYLTNYHEFAQPDGLLEYRADVTSANIPSFTMQ